MILVFSCGRTGTNLVLEILTGSPLLKASDPPEDKFIFRRNIQYPENYVTKCDIAYCQSYDTFELFMKNNPKSSIIWTIRDPRDMILSKLYRGWYRSDDGTPQGCLDTMYAMYNFYLRAIDEFSNNILTIKMEDVILNIEDVINRITKFTNLSIHNNMFYPYKRMRHPGKRTRYNCLDQSQISLWKNYKEIYNGFFRNRAKIIEPMFDTVKPMIRYFGYRS